MRLASAKRGAGDFPRIDQSSCEMKLSNRLRRVGVAAVTAGRGLRLDHSLGRAALRWTAVFRPRHHAASPDKAVHFFSPWSDDSGTDEERGGAELSAKTLRDSGGSTDPRHLVHAVQRPDGADGEDGHEETCADERGPVLATDAPM